MNNYMVVALGGALGSVARYGASGAMRAQWPTFPWGTLFVNIVGGFLIGVVAAYAAARPGFSNTLRLGLTTGIMGGFTTFSAFSLETMLLWSEGRSGAALINIGSNVILSLAACALGLFVGRAISVYA